MPYLEIRTTRGSIRSYAEHFHQTFSIGLILQGQTRLTCAGEEHLAGQNDIVLIEPEQAHSCNPVPGTTRSYHMLYLDTEWCLQQAGGAFLDAQKPYVRQRIVRDAELSEDLLRVVAAISTNEQSKAGELGLLIGRLLQRYCLPEAQTPNPRPTQAIAAARDTLAGQMECPPKIADLAHRAGLCREGFIRSFQRSMGLPPGMYGQCARLEEGRRLLRRGASITEAALATGYADQSHFHRMFVRYFSATPHQYRKNASLSFKK